jgi:tetratricopeptide (TPR) repeat protein
MCKSVLQKHDEALEDFTTAIEIDKNFSMAYLNRGTMHVVFNKKDDALRDFTMAIDLGTII